MAVCTRSFRRMRKTYWISIAVGISCIIAILILGSVLGTQNLFSFVCFIPLALALVTSTFISFSIVSKLGSASCCVCGKQIYPMVALLHGRNYCSHEVGEIKTDEKS